MADLQFESPRSVPEALHLLHKGGSEVKIISGGTNVVIYLRERWIHPRLLVDVSRIPGWDSISREEHSTRLAPNCTMTDLLRSPQLTDGAQLLPMAAEWFAGPSIRNRATVAGNIADASPAADITVPLLALDAEVELSRDGTAPRRLRLQDFVLGPRKTALAPDELITAITIANTPGAGVAYDKLGKRDSLAISIVSVAVLLETQDSRCRKARIALGAVAPVPFRAVEAEASLLGQPVTPRAAAQAGKLARAAAKPISDVRGGAQYRSEMVEVLVTRLIEGLINSKER